MRKLCWLLFISYQVKNYETLMNAYLNHGADIVKLLEFNKPLNHEHRETRAKSQFAPNAHSDGGDGEIDDLEMEC